MRLIVYIEADDNEIEAGTSAGPDRYRHFKERLASAVDHQWPYAPIGSFRVISVTEQREPTETELIGPLG